MRQSKVALLWAKILAYFCEQQEDVNTMASVITALDVSKWMKCLSFSFQISGTMNGSLGHASMHTISSMPSAYHRRYNTGGSTAQRYHGGTAPRKRSVEVVSPIEEQMKERRKSSAAIKDLKDRAVPIPEVQIVINDAPLTSGDIPDTPPPDYEGDDQFSFSNVVNRDRNTNANTNNNASTINNKRQGQSSDMLY